MVGEVWRVGLADVTKVMGRTGLSSIVVVVVVIRLAGVVSSDSDIL